MGGCSAPRPSGPVVVVDSPETGGSARSASLLRRVLPCQVMTHTTSHLAGHSKLRPSVSLTLTPSPTGGSPIPPVSSPPRPSAVRRSGPMQTCSASVLQIIHPGWNASVRGIRWLISPSGDTAPTFAAAGRPMLTDSGAWAYASVRSCTGNTSPTPITCL